jgi:predicted RNA binding protein YcfA (HicA-like mRNA interferase family)
MLLYVVSRTELERLCFVARDKRRLLEELRQKKRSCSFGEAEAALIAWGFVAGRSKGHVQVWTCKHVTLTLHAPHKDLDPGAVAMIIRKIEEADILQQMEQKGEGGDE